MPVTLANEAVAGLSCTTYCTPDCKARLPEIVIDEPGVPLPGAKTEPDANVTVPGGSTRPVPVRAPPAFTVTLEEFVIAPSTSSVPPLTMVAPV